MSGEILFDVHFKLSLKYALFSELNLDSVREKCRPKQLYSSVKS